MASRLKGESRSGGIVVSMEKDGLKYSETYEFLVETDDKNIGRAEVLLTEGLPILYESQSVGGPAICNELTADRDEKNPLYWKVKASFSSDVDEGQDGSKNAENVGSPPTEWKADVSLSFERYERIVRMDVNDKTFKNTLGGWIDGGLTINKRTVKQGFVQFEPATKTVFEILDQTDGVVNSGGFKGFPEKTLLLQVDSAEKGWYFGYNCWRIGYQLIYKADTWKRRVLNTSGWFKDPSNGNKFTSFASKDGTAGEGPFTTLPVGSYSQVNGVGLIDANGFPIPPGGDPVILEFDVYRDVNFASILRLV